MDNSNPVRIGVFSGEIVEPKARMIYCPPGKLPKTDSGPTLTVIEPEPKPEPQAATASPTDSWTAYSDWRKTKCPSEGIRSKVEDLDQAVHEFVGEVSEFAAVICDEGWTKCIDDTRRKLLFEAGDVFFCGVWLMDACGSNVLREQAEIEFGGEDQDGHAERLMRLVIGYLENEAKPGGASDESWASDVDSTSMALNLSALQACIRAGSICDSFKKAVWQKRPIAAGNFYMPVLQVFYVVERILGLFGHRTVDALKSKVEKLNARFPDGWQPGGGKREGIGGN
jgi:hypothetical protein